MDKIINHSPFSFKEFNEFGKNEKDKIAASLETRYAETLLSPIVENYVYGTTIALSFGDKHGQLDKKALYEHAINKNADYFDYKELMEQYEPNNDGKKIARYESYKTALVYKNHESNDVNNSIGFVLDSVLVTEPYDDMRAVILFNVDKLRAPAIARMLQTYPTKVATSMGTKISHSECLVCGQKVYKEADLCDHLKYKRGQRCFGKVAAEYLYGINFYEQSIVSIPAAPRAMVLDVISDLIPGRLLKVASESGDTTTIQIMNTLFESIKMAKTVDEKRRLKHSFDKLINKLEKL
jgi:hypothetical protein